MTESSPTTDTTEPAGRDAEPSSRCAAPGHAPSAADADSARFESSPFYRALVAALGRRGVRPEEVCDAGDACSRRLLAEYGAMFVASERIAVPPVCVFRDEAEVARFQQLARPRAADFGGVRVELQSAALDALVAAREEARREGLDITPRDGPEAARRGYADTVRLWESRVRPALEHWVAEGRVPTEEAERVRSLVSSDQVACVLELEACGCFFSKDLSKTILQSVAAPGSSQHLALLAFDAVEFRDARVREILARRGWFQTVLKDLPHFTYLGVEERELPGLGLRRVVDDGQVFWVPDVTGGDDGD